MKSVLISKKTNEIAPKKQKSKKLNFETAHMSGEDVANLLYEVAKKRKLVNKKKKNFIGNANFSSIYNSDELSSILNETIAKVIKSFEAYINRCKGIKVIETFVDEVEYERDCYGNIIENISKKRLKDKNTPNISENLDLSTIGNLTGYFITAFNQNVSKDYKKNSGGKRNADSISMDGIIDSENKEAHAVFNQIKVDTIEDRDNLEEHERILTNFWKFLRAYDKNVNSELNRRRVSPKKDKTSQLSYLFLYLINPKYKGKFVNISSKFPTWSNYIYDKNLIAMIEILKQNFPEDVRDFYSHIMNQKSEFGETIRPKMSKNYYDQSCSVTTTIDEKYNKNDVTISVNIHLYRLDNGKNSIIKTETISDTTSLENLEQLKLELKNKAKTKIEEMKNEAQSRRIAASAEIYSYNK